MDWHYMRLRSRVKDALLTGIVQKQAAASVAIILHSFLLATTEVRITLNRGTDFTFDLDGWESSMLGCQIRCIGREGGNSNDLGEVNVSYQGTESCRASAGGYDSGRSAGSCATKHPSAAHERRPGSRAWRAGVWPVP